MKTNETTLNLVKMAQYRRFDDLLEILGDEWDYEYDHTENEQDFEGNCLAYTTPALFTNSRTGETFTIQETQYFIMDEDYDFLLLEDN